MSKSFFPRVFFPSVLFVFFVVLSFISFRNDLPLFYAKLAWSLFVSYIGFRIYKDNNISKYRSILFVLTAFFFFLEFKLFRFFSLTGNIPPYCHIAQASTLSNFIYNQFLAITSKNWQVWGVLSLGFLWLLIMFTIGQGICSWVCFYGGIDEFFAKLLKKPVIKLNITNAWRDFPIAFLIFLLIVSFLQGLPVFCNWFCPLKMTEAFWDSDSVIRIAQTVLFLLSLVVFLILLPLLSKKRTFCSLICPFGALVSVCGKATPYRVDINEQKCTCCGKCFDVCPVFAIQRMDSDKLKISSYCNKCGECIDACPVGAINMSVLGQTASKIEINSNFAIAKFARRADRLNPKDLILFVGVSQKICYIFSNANFGIRDIFVFLALLMSWAVSVSFVPQIVLRLLVGKG